MNNDLDGRVAIITGATGGIGSAIATEFYNLGAKLVITARDQDKLIVLGNKIAEKSTRENNIKPLCIPLDLTAIDAEKVLISRTIETYGKLDILVNNAGLVEGCMFLKTDKEFMSKMMQVNFITPYFLTQAALIYMLKNKFGRIINITSIAGFMGDAGMSAYAASKGAMASAAKSIAAEYGRRNITVNCIAPGIIDTEATKKLPPERAKELKAQIPMRRFGKPEEVAALVAFLASERAAYINGQQYHLNGGLVR